MPDLKKDPGMNTTQVAIGIGWLLAMVSFPSIAAYGQGPSPGRQSGDLLQ